MFIENLDDQATYNWISSDGTYLEGDSYILSTCSYVDQGDYSVNAGIGMCISEPFDFSVIIKDIPSTEIVSENEYICPGESTILTISELMLTANWSNGEIGKEIIVNEPRYYSVMYFDEYCGDTTGYEIKEFCELTFPNIFTPNKDGFNDIFSPHQMDNDIPQYELNIYNKWGVLVFSSDDVRIGWDGLVNGNDSASGVYFFVSKYTNLKGQIQTRQGYVELIR